MSSAQPRLDHPNPPDPGELSPREERRQTRRTRRKRMLRGLLAMLVAVLLALLVVLLNAGRWGVPMFSFTNDNGAHCTNTFLGYRCTDLTLRDVEDAAGVALPASSRVVKGTLGHEPQTKLNALVELPAAEATATWEQLRDHFGDCRQDLATSLRDEPGLTGHCVMTNESGIVTQGTPGPRVWSVATATKPDGNTLVALDIRER